MNDLEISVAQLDYILFGHKSMTTPFTPAPGNPLPKNLHLPTLQQVVQLLSYCGSPLSAEEVAEGVGIRQATARRYLSYLEQRRLVEADLSERLEPAVKKYILCG